VELIMGMEVMTVEQMEKVLEVVKNLIVGYHDLPPEDLADDDEDAVEAAS
jgi:hypothetical protein